MVPGYLIGYRYIYLKTTFLIRIILIDHHLKIVLQSFLSLDKWHFCCCFLFDMSNSSWIIVRLIQPAAVVTKKLSLLLDRMKTRTWRECFDVVANTYPVSLVSSLFLISNGFANQMHEIIILEKTYLKFFLSNINNCKDMCVVY